MKRPNGSVVLFFRRMAHYTRVACQKDYRPVVRKIPLATGKGSWQWQNMKHDIKVRDGFKCIECGNREFLHVHHIKLAKDFPELFHDPNNCQTLCNQCHAKKHPEFKMMLGRK